MSCFLLSRYSSSGVFIAIEYVPVMNRSANAVCGALDRVNNPITYFVSDPPATGDWWQAQSVTNASNYSYEARVNFVTYGAGY